MCWEKKSTCTLLEISDVHVVPGVNSAPRQGYKCLVSQL